MKRNSIVFVEISEKNSRKSDLKVYAVRLFLFLKYGIKIIHIL